MAASPGDDFQVVSRSRRRGKKSGNNKSYGKPLLHGSHRLEAGDENNCDFDLKRCRKRLNECIQDILLSDFFQESYDTILSALSFLIESKTTQGITLSNQETRVSKETLHGELKTVGNPCQQPRQVSKDSTTTDIFPHPVHLLCYGIGRFSSCPIACYQLAFLLTLKEKFNNPPCHVYDPVMMAHEKSILQDLGCSLIETNEEGKRVCHVPTVAFLPHCGKALYNNLIWANLTCHQDQGGIQNLILIGNSFTSMIHRNPESQLQKTANYVKKIHPYLKETALPLYSVHPDVFNDLSLHTFPSQMFEYVVSDFWTNNPEPSYDEEEVEMIMSKASLGSQ